ncbi:hypothetical protein EC988_000741 [Linderina pennispora]|nr:hypothetical protein EC988_000741 [Linderina pennispora]
MAFLFRISSRQSDRTLYSADAAPTSTKNNATPSRHSNQSSSISTIGEATILGQKVPENGLQYGSITLAPFKQNNSVIMFL